MLPQLYSCMIKKNSSIPLTGTIHLRQGAIADCHSVGKYGSVEGSRCDRLCTDDEMKAVTGETYVPQCGDWHSLDCMVPCRAEGLSGSKIKYDDVQWDRDQVLTVTNST